MGLLEAVSRPTAVHYRYVGYWPEWNGAQGDLAAASPSDVRIVHHKTIGIDAPWLGDGTPQSDRRFNNRSNHSGLMPASFTTCL